VGMDDFPSLSQLLDRQTLPPICLFNLYVYLREMEHAQHIVDFWLDVVAHENICKLYTKDIIRKHLKRASLLSQSSSAGNSPLRTKLPSQGEKFSFKRISIHDVNNELRYSLISTTDKSSMETSRVDSFDLPKESVEVQRKVNRDEIRKSAERLYRMYLVPGAVREISLPEELRYRAIKAIDTQNRDDPGAFEEAKEYAFGLLESGPYKRFIIEMSKHNITLKHALISMIIGLLLLFIAFTIFLSCIFLDLDRIFRMWGLMPLVFGLLFVVTGHFRFNPLFVQVKKCESMFLNFSDVKEPNILKLHQKKARVLWMAMLVALIVFIAIFFSIPGYRL